MITQAAAIRVPAAARPGIPKGDPLYRAPPIAWPTIALFASALLCWSAALTAALRGWLAPAPAIVLQGLAAYLMFTVLHDGVHRSTARAYPWLNALLTHASAFFLGPLAAAPAFRYVHFKHHRHTNEGETDPDLWSGAARFPWSLPLQWATADLHYLRVILRDSDNIPAREQLAIGLPVITMFALFAGAWSLGYGMEAVLYWLLPSRIAILLLAFAFNFLPHHPHLVTQAHNPYAATNVRSGGEPLMKWLFLYQNHHLIHHLFPSIPFYHYQRIWQQRRAEFEALGAPVVPLFKLEAEPSLAAARPTG